MGALAKKGDYGEAVRVFKELAAKLSPTPVGHVATEFTRSAGQAAVRALIKSFAFAPCYYCSAGRMTCELCDGADTISANGRYCEECGGAGATPCSFCGGSGFLSFDAVPPSLATTVASRRLKWVGSSLRTLARRSAGLSRSHPTRDIPIELSDLLHRTVRIGAVLDNVAPVIRNPHHERHQSTIASQTAKQIQEYARVNTSYHDHIANAIVKYCEGKANSAVPDSEQHTIWQRRKEFYKSMRPVQIDDDEEPDGGGDHPSSVTG